MRSFSSHEIKHRLFIVGCPRSGTTLLQSCLANHSEILSFPESHFFEKTYPTWEPKRRLTGIASRAAKDHISKYLDTIDASEYAQKLSPFTIFISQYTNFFAHTLDELTRKADKNIWLEKTPKHLEFIDLIQKFVNQSKIIHILRDGPDVIASLYEVTSQNPQRWSGKRSIDECIERWEKSIEISRYYLSKKDPSHIFIHYEELTRDPRRQLERICCWLDIPFQGEMINNRQKLERIIQPHETWKQNVSAEIRNRPRQKFRKLFSVSEQKYILDRINALQE